MQHRCQFPPRVLSQFVSKTSACVAIGLPPDQPLKLGSGPPRRAPPSLRIAASEAALGGARPAAGASASKASFIAAARRAAQAAGQEQRRPHLARRYAQSSPSDVIPPMRSRVATRVKSVLLAASIVAIIAGSFQLRGNIFDFSIFDTIESKLAANVDSDAVGTDAEEGDAASVAAIPNHEPASPGTVAIR